MLIWKEAGINAEDAEGKTPLIYAVEKGHREAISELVEHNAYGHARVNTQTKTGKTPLHFAVATGDLDIVKYLVLFGAKTDTKDIDGKTPLDDAQPFPDITQWLESKLKK